MVVLVSLHYNFETLREKMSFIRKIAKQKEQQSKDKSAENESCGSVNIQVIDLKQMFQWCLEFVFFHFKFYYDKKFWFFWTKHSQFLFNS